MKKWLICLISLTIVSAIALAACSGKRASADVNGTYYLYENEVLDKSSFISLKNGAWNDDEEDAGSYVVDGTKITLYVEFPGEKEEYASGVVENGKLTLTILGAEVVYYIEGSQPSGSQEPPHEHTYSEWQSDETYHWRFATCEHDEEIKEIEQHTFGYDNKCAVCKYELDYTEGLEYTLNADESSYSVSGIGEARDNIITIPYGHEDLPVTEIADDAFKNCTQIVAVRLPKGITGIGTNAFWGCGELVSITLPETLKGIGRAAFADCNKLYEVYNLSSVNLEKNQIECYLNYAGIKNLYTTGEVKSSVSIKDGYVFITFKDKIHLVGYVGDETALTLPRDLAGEGYDIYDNAFIQNKAIESVTIPEGVTDVGDNAFYDCTALAIADLPDTLISLGAHSFAQSGLKTLTVPSQLDKIGNEAFGSCPDLERVTLADGLKIIGEGMFYGCEKLTNVTVPASVYEIGESAFAGGGIADVTLEQTSGWNLCVFGVTPEELADTKTAAEYLKTTYANKAWRRYDYDGTYHWLGNGAPEEHSFGGSAFVSADTCSECGFRNVPTEGLNYYLDTTTQTYSVTGMEKGTQATNIIIPATYQDKPVTAIYSDAFENCRNLTSISLPNSITQIGGDAFKNCSGLTRITIPASVTSIGENAFNGCSGLTGVYITDLTAWCRIDFSDNPLLYAHDLYLDGLLQTTIEIPEAVTEIKDYAFEGCSATSFVLPENLSAIAQSAFSECNNLVYNEYENAKYLGNRENPYLALIKAEWGETYVINEKTKLIGEKAFYMNRYSNKIHVNLTNITIPAGVTSIGREAFFDCYNLETVTFAGDSALTSIGERAFEGCSHLSGMTIPAGVTEIGDLAFGSCIALTEIAIPAGVTSIGAGAFYGCNGVTRITVEQGNAKYSGAGDCLIDKETKTLLFGCKNSVIPTDGSVTSIESNAFEDCSGLTSIAIPASVTSIGAFAFYGCTELQTVTCENNGELNAIGRYAFNKCGKLKDVSIPAGVTSIGEEAFAECAEVNLHIADLTAWCNIDFGVMWMGQTFHLYLNDTLQTSLTIPQGVQTIKARAFRFGSFTSVTFSSDVTAIGQEAFYGCKLTSLNFPKNVTSIGYSAFGCCADLQTVTFEKGSELKTIGNYAFSLCGSLRTIVIPESVTSIGQYAFNSCNNLQKVYLGKTSGDWRSVVWSNGNEAYLNAAKYYYSEQATNKDGYWHYDEDGNAAEWPQA